MRPHGISNNCLAVARRGESPQYRLPTGGSSSFYPEKFRKFSPHLGASAPERWLRPPLADVRRSLPIAPQWLPDRLTAFVKPIPGVIHGLRILGQQDR